MREEVSIPVESLRISFGKKGREGERHYEWSLAADGSPDLMHIPMLHTLDFDAGETTEITLRFEEGSAWIAGTMETAVPNQLGEAQ